MSDSSSNVAREAAHLPSRPSYLKLVLDQTLITSQVRDYDYPGSGTTKDPYLVDWLPNDPKNGFNLPPAIKWTIVLICAFSTLACSLSSTIFAGAIIQIEDFFHVKEEIAILSVCLYVLGFALGPVLWGPLSELYGRQSIYLVTMGASVLFEGAATASKSNEVAALIILRFLVGSFSSAAISNSPGVVADIFAPAERGLAVMVYSMFPFLGPTLGPICGNFLAAAAGWRWVNVLCTVFFALMFVLGLVFMPETYAPYILRRRAMIMSKKTGKIYVSKLDVGLPPKTLTATLSTAITRPIIMAIWEPISTAMAVYAAIIYGILYLIFAAFPIIFIDDRHWSQGVSGLSYIGIMIGQILAVPFYIVLEVKYRKIIARPGVLATPEMRLEPALYGAVMLPVSLFWFAWTSYTSIHWAVGLVGTLFFGLGNVLVFISMTNYLIDTYSLFAATAAATNAMARALFGFAFPLFTTYMYKNLGSQWASSIPAFLSLAFMPLPFIFLRVGSKLRANSKFANEAKQQLAKLQEVRQNVEKLFKAKHVGDNTISSDTEAAVEPERVASTIPTKSEITAVDRSDSGSN
ncbi:Major facilitator superfamily domain general substrate transporter [Penicillium verhagenii]|uniref:Major facilitator superfamily domain general substrate transporter n=1 Tax=Penicillium verhagenii TaxID=1562060 RepID=UPI002545AC34|nr:Major facilitator superfamily domain general substrate transporter [Penicillium verhagenii]KAJ5939492.1 Major facilitator superfamily domain general substrate transporter [Penicillium verhagenii]